MHIYQLHISTKLKNNQENESLSFLQLRKLGFAIWMHDLVCNRTLIFGFLSKVGFAAKKNNATKLMQWSVTNSKFKWTKHAESAKALHFTAMVLATASIYIQNLSL